VGISKNEDVVIKFFEMPTLHRRKIKHNNEPSNYMKKIQEGLYDFFPNFPKSLANLVEFSICEIYIYLFMGYQVTKISQKNVACQVHNLASSVL
jgi:predicted PolB exonuclease-like 3'-5' exonuclease